MDKLLWYFYKEKNYIGAILQYKILKRPIRWKHWAGKKILSPEESNKVIYDAIMQNRPFLACRNANAENGPVLYMIREQLGVGNPIGMEEIRKHLCTNAGMFSVELENIYKFAELYLAATEKTDLYACWLKEDEEYCIKKYIPKTQITRLGGLEPYYSKEIMWTKALENKKVLVVHPFAVSIRKQYQIKDKIWGKRNILPDFDLQVFEAVQTSGGARDERFETWFDALEYMVNEIKHRDFDVAILGCGAYAVPLASEIKMLGKQAIVLGGATQILFGIRGKRWEEREFFRNMMNEYWIRPNDGEKPEKASEVEGGCYW